MKNTIKYIGILIIGMIIGLTINLNNNIVDAEVDNFKISKTWINESGNTIVDFNDNSYAILNQSTNTFEFYAAELEDWEVKADNQDQLLKIIATYMIHKYDIPEETALENNMFLNVFKDKNLTSSLNIKEVLQ